MTIVPFINQAHPRDILPGSIESNVPSNIALLCGRRLAWNFFISVVRAAVDIFSPALCALVMPRRAAFFIVVWHFGVVKLYLAVPRPAAKYAGVDVSGPLDQHSKLLITLATYNPTRHGLLNYSGIIGRQI
jgi:hypothetical protein